MTPREFRAPDKLWEALQAIADERDEYLSEVVRTALESYVKTESTKEETS